MVLKHVRRVGKTVGISGESFADVSEGVHSLGAVQVLREHTVGGEHAEDALKVFGVAGGAGGKDTCQDLGGGERGVGTALPDGIGDVEADDGV